jgi:hypothetical protein
MNVTEFEGKDGKTYTIAIDDDGELITVACGTEKLGSISLHRYEVDDNASFDFFRVTHLELETPSGTGVGRRCLQFHKELFGCRIEAGVEGLRMDDGSHLTERGPGFMARMREEGIVDEA